MLHVIAVAKSSHFFLFFKSGGDPIRYFGNAKYHEKVSGYDQTFAVKEGYSQKLKREDFQHTQVSNTVYYHYFV